ncbi:MAG TPA: HD domain-containing protein [Candidatus Dorea intestinavium]|nr:HD domain-containing protein [Candidatus Dorea intestinavium]
MNKIQINLYDLLTCISNVQDLITKRLSRHQKQVGYLSYRLAEELEFPLEKIRDVFIAGIIHDIGALSTREKLELIESEPTNVNSHAFRGAKLFENFGPLKSITGILKYHHVPWNDGEGMFYEGEEVPLESQIVHLADKVCLLIDDHRNVIAQIPHIFEQIEEKSGSEFHPYFVEALQKLKPKEYIWLDLASPDPSDKIALKNPFNMQVLDIDDITDLAVIFSRIIDFRSRFTSRHSAGVAKTAEKLAELSGFSPYECKMMLIAGYLHDLGKVAISDSILEKPSKLNSDEFSEMRGHTYYTYQSLKPIKQFETINTWASFHHEKLNGKGYPFHIMGENLSLGSRIMAVADIFTAITESRPYREGLCQCEVIEILNNMVEADGIDGKIVNIIIDHYDELNQIREEAQIIAAKEYAEFMKIR